MDDLWAPLNHNFNQSNETFQSARECLNSEDGFKFPQIPPLPKNVWATIVRYAEPADAQTLMLSYRPISPTSSESSHQKDPAVYQLPLELIQQCFLYLDPLDFDAARHVCRPWYHASLDKSLLESMLKRMGWWSAGLSDLLSAEVTARVPGITNEAWILSRRLSLECSLIPGWTGNGVERAFPTPTKVLHTIGGSSISCALPQGLRLSSSIELSDLASAHTIRDNVYTPNLVVTISACGSFLMLTDGCVVYVYRMGDDGLPLEKSGVAEKARLTPLTSIVCPRKIIAVSMDTSSQRFSVAVLLEGRMGMVCEIVDLSRSRDRSSRQTDPVSSSAQQAASQTTSIWDQRMAIRSSERSSTHRLGGFAPAASGSRPPHNSWANEPWPSARDDIQHRLGTGPSGTRPTTDQDPDFENWGPLGLLNHRNARSIYNELCSEEDPPRSVAICPQRKCVAFGCSAGIELHWVDAASGQDLNRWFPLSAPSDHLYFLPPRPNVDTAKKLRLISSAAHPYTLQRNQAPAMAASDSLSSRFFADTSIRRANVHFSSDHYHAMPIRDGYHILFTDPNSGLLCIGSDAPAGGPTKLIRKMYFVGPRDSIPLVYGSGSDLKWGIRIVAGYEDDRLFLFNVPPDVFNASRVQPPTAAADKRTAPSPSPCYSTSPPRYSEKVATLNPDEPNFVWQDWYYPSINPTQDASVEGTSSSTSFPAPLWPVYIPGVEIGHVEGLVNVSITMGPHSHCTVWAFTKNGICHSFEVNNGGDPHKVRQMMALREGTVVDTIDVEGDTHMRDAAKMPPPPPTQEEEYEAMWEAREMAELQRSRADPPAPSLPTSRRRRSGKRFRNRVRARLWGDRDRDREVGNETAAEEGGASVSSGGRRRSHGLDGLEEVDEDGDVVMAGMGEHHRGLASDGDGDVEMMGDGGDTATTAAVENAWSSRVEDFGLFPTGDHHDQHGEVQQQADNDLEDEGYQTDENDVDDDTGLVYHNFHHLPRETHGLPHISEDDSEDFDDDDEALDLGAPPPTPLLASQPEEVRVSSSVAEVVGFRMRIRGTMGEDGVDLQRLVRERVLEWGDWEGEGWLW
ncbi:MAG: hypothetical protein M1817_001789 [Caeruleum heppii]|nr:MAG: hypothetical protein M1817_001789 [Caeruleum heppii]